MQLFCENQLLEVIEGIPNTCSFSWTVPGRESRSCQVTIVVGSGQMASSGNFIISRPPVLREIDIGGPGREPSSIREFVVFTSNRNGNEDLWIKNRRTGDLDQSTFFPGKDGEANLFKPNGNVFAFTTERTGRKEIWMMSIITREAKQVTKSGGSSPAWQPSFFQFPTIAYKRMEASNVSRTHIYATRLQIPTTDIVPLPVTIPVFPEDQVSSGSSAIGSTSNIKSMDWGNPGVDNLIMYDNGIAPSTLWRLLVPFEGISVSGRNQPNRFNIPVGISPSHPSFSLSGAKIAFSSGGDLWFISINGGAPTQLTSGTEEDNFPDWSSESEIVFQRRLTDTSPWELWSIRIGG